MIKIDFQYHCFDMFSLFSFKYIYSFFFSSSVHSLPTLFSLFCLREQWDMCLCWFFLSLFWLSLCKMFFIYFLSCPVVINYVVKKKKNLSISFLKTGTTNETFQNSEKQDSFRHILKSSANMHESSDSQFFNHHLNTIRTRRFWWIKVCYDLFNHLGSYRNIL